jgi:hypothetical protein
MILRSNWNFWNILSACLAGAVLAFAAAPRPASALPAFAAQTGQPCQMCHVGGFGPQLTPYGRNFKLNGYTQRAGRVNAPIAAMVVASYLNTQKNQPAPPAPGFGVNNNLALDQASLFLAGGIGSHFGGIAQVTYDGVARAWTWDNTDLRALTTTTIGGQSVLLGASLNNNPTVEDPWNTLPAWGFPYTSSRLAPSPSAAPILDGALAQNTIGLTGYAWINSEFYVEAGAYGSPGANFLTTLGADPFSPGPISGLAPYVRVAAQKVIGGHTLEAGGFFFQPAIFPGADRSVGMADTFRDLGLDASDVWAISNGDEVTLNARFTNEHQTLNASVPLGLASNPTDVLNELRADVAYYWKSKIGLTVQVFDTWGSADALLYGANRTLSPDTSGFTVQLDGTPFGDKSQPRRRINLRAGVQYTLFTRFDGAGVNFDGAGARASDENSFRLFTWLAF